ncbi:hypothetical protein PISMIDRAFT_90373, partial [Pisolithus microcarpus 441]
HATFRIFPPPPELPLTAEQPDKRIHGQALAFREKGSELVVAYLNHGVVCWDTRSFKQHWQINPIHIIILWICFENCPSGHVALSSDKKHIALTNLGYGVDIYSLGWSHPDIHLEN